MLPSQSSSRRRPGSNSSVASRADQWVPAFAGTTVHFAMAAASGEMLARTRGRVAGAGRLEQSAAHPDRNDAGDDQHDAEPADAGYRLAEKPRRCDDDRNELERCE